MSPASNTLRVNTQLVAQTLTLQGPVPAALTIDQLSVKEDGVEQKVLSLEPISTSVQTSHPEQATTVLMLFDQLNTNFQDQMVGLNELKKVFKNPPALPATSFYTLTRNFNRIVDFTTDSKLLLAGINRVMPVRPPQIQQDSTSSPNDASRRRPATSAMSMADSAPGGRGVEAVLSAQIRRLTTLQTLARLAGDLQHRPGRKVVLWMGDGITFAPTPGENPSTAPDTTDTDRYQTVLRMLASAQVELYLLDLRGLPSSPGGVFFLHSEMNNAARLTGGRALLDSNDYRASILSSFELPESTYRLTYRSTNQKYDGAFRTVNIAVKIPHVQVKTRSGYFATSPQDDRTRISNIIRIAARRESPEMNELRVNTQPEQPIPAQTAPLLHIRAPFAELASLPSSQPGTVCYAVVAFLVGWKEGSDGPISPVFKAMTISAKTESTPEFAELALQFTGKPAKYLVRGGIVDLHSFKAGTAVAAAQIPKP